MNSDMLPAVPVSPSRLRLPFALIVVAVALLSASASVDLKQTPAPENPLVLNPPSLTVEGTVMRAADTNKPVEFTLENRGQSPIKVLGIESTCLCMTVDEFKPMALRPGESKVVQLKVKVPAFGEKESSIRILTDDAFQPIKTLSVRAIGSPPDKPFVVASTHSLSLSGSEASQPLSEIFEVNTIELSDSKDAWIVGAKSTSSLSLIEVESREIEEVLKDGRKRCVYQMRFTTIAPSQDQIQRTESISLVTNGEALTAPPQWTVLVSLTPRAQAFPSFVRRSISTEGENPPIATVIVKAEPICQIERIELNQPWVEAKLIANSERTSNMQRVEFVFDISKRPAGDIDSKCFAKIVLKVPEEASVKIPIVLSSK